MNKYLFSILMMGILSMPAWIRLVSFRPWRPLLKMIIISAMVLISTGFSIYVYLKPTVNPTALKIWAVNISLALYYIVVLVTAFSSLPRRREKYRFILANTPDSKLGPIKNNSLNKIAMKKNKSYISIPSMTGTDGETGVVLVNATFQVNKDSTKHYPHPEFGAWLLDEIYNTKKIFAVKRGLFSKKFFCSACNTELDPSSYAPKRIEYELMFGPFPPFSVQITVPAIECQNCNKICGFDEKGSLSNHLNGAIIHAFESENIKP